MLQKDMEPIIRFIDKKNVISHKLSKQHFSKEDNHLKKDLSRLGRSLSNTVLVDVESSKDYLSNTLVLKRWKGDAEDRDL